MSSVAGLKLAFPWVQSVAIDQFVSLVIVGNVARATEAYRVPHPCPSGTPPCPVLTPANMSQEGFEAWAPLAMPGAPVEKLVELYGGHPAYTSFCDDIAACAIKAKLRE